MHRLDRRLGQFVRNARESLGFSQQDLARKLGWSQSKLSRVEQGKSSLTLAEAGQLALRLRSSVSELLRVCEQDSAGTGPEWEDESRFSAGFFDVLQNEDALTAQLARYGVKFLSSVRHPAFVALPQEEVVLAALKSRDARVFEALPALLLKNATNLNWAKLVSGSYTLRLQNRLGMAVSAALELRRECSDFSDDVWVTLRQVHDRLAEVRLDREDSVGPFPETQSVAQFLRANTPPWLQFWHALGSGDLESYRRHLR